MNSMKVAALMLKSYILLSVLLLPSLCLCLQNNPVITAEAACTGNDAKAVDQGVAYVLMAIALLVTYLIH